MASTLYFIKKNVGVGNVTIDFKNDIASYTIRKRSLLSQYIFPIFALLLGIFQMLRKSKMRFQLIRSGKLT